MPVRKLLVHLKTFNYGNEEPMNADEMIACASHNGTPQGQLAYDEWVRICREYESREQREDAWLRMQHNCDAHHRWDGWFKATTACVELIPDTAELQPVYPRGDTAWRVGMRIAIDPGHVKLKGKRLIYGV